jgi:hypothetical protein
MPHGSSSRHAVSSVLSSSMLSPGSRMNSHRRRPGPPDTSVVGRAGSQIWMFSGRHIFGSCGTTSTISQSKKNPRSVTVAPSCERTKLLEPSQPTAKLACTVLGRPSMLTRLIVTLAEPGSTPTAS